MNLATVKLSFLLLLLASLLCFAEDNSFRYKSFKDIPGVTFEEIGAIEVLRERTEFFVYGMNPGTENFLDEDSLVKGFTALFCDLLTELFGIPFKPQLYEWDNLVAGLASGEIAFTGDLTATEERKKTYFMTDPIAIRSVKRFRLAGSLPIQEIAANRLLKYAFLDGTTTNDDVRTASSMPYEAVFVDNYEEAYNLLKNKKVDAFFDENPAELVFDVYNDVVSEIFFPLIYSEVSLSTQTPELEPIISVVQKMLKNGGDKHLVELYDLGQYAYIKNKLFKSLTEEEHEYIRNNTVIPLLAEYDNYPLSFYNRREEEWQGVVFDVLKEIENLTGLSFRVINNKDTPWNNIMNMLETGKGSIVTGLVRTPEREGRFLWPESAVTQDYYALISKSDFRDISVSEISHAKIGLVKGIAYTETFKRWFPSHSNIKEYDGGDQLFEALERGEIDLAMSCNNQLLYLTNYLELPGFKVNIKFDSPYDLTFGFHKNEIILRGIVDKALGIIDRGMLTNRWTRKTYDYRVKLAEEKYPLFIGIGTLLLCVLLLVFILMLRNRSEGKRLERVVQARTAELEKASQAKSNFLAKMSHEIRTPMNAIIGMAELALRENMNATAKEHVATIKHAGVNLLSIINEILDLSKIESGKMEIVPVDYRFSSLISDVSDIIKARLLNSKVNFTVSIDKRIPNVLFGDEAKVRQILLNILGNAVKFTKEGGISLMVTGKTTSENTVILTMYVADTGKGIKPEDIGKLFGEFVQVDLKANKGVEGTGLGLAITKSLAKAMGGNISVASKYGKGSVFTVTIPQKIGSLKSLANSNKHATKIFTAPSARILIVDDINTNLKVAEGLMKPYKMAIDLCNSGAEAIQAIKANNYDLIFMDHMMPEMDGIEATKRIREMGYIRPIIALTANALVGQAEIFLANGFNDFLSKPINTAKLNAILEKWLPAWKQVS